MKTLLVLILVIISSVVGLDNLDYIKYKGLCENKADNSVLRDLVQDRSEDEYCDDCRHSIGFHFDKDLCYSLRDPMKPSYDSRDFTAFLSENDEYLYLFVNVMTNNQIYIQQNSKQIVVDIKEIYDSGLGYFWNSWRSQKNALFVIWIKEKRVRLSSDAYKITYSPSSGSSLKTETTEKLSMRTDQQILINDFKPTSNVTISFASETNDNLLDRISIRDSYLIFCGQKKGQTFRHTTCRPIEKDEQIQCLCEKGNNTLVFLILVIFLAAVLLAFAKPVMDSLTDTHKNQRTYFLIHHNCTDKNMKYKYVLVLRMTKSNADTDLTDVNIDIEFFSHNNQSVAPNYRLRAKVLDTQPVTDIKLAFCMLTKMPELKQIQCNHSGQHEDKIFLLGVFRHGIIGETGPNSSVNYKIAKNITRNQRRFNLHVLKADQDVAYIPTEANTNVSLNRITFSLVIIFSILFADISFIALVSTLFEMQFNSIFTQMVLNIGVTTLFAIGFNVLMVLIYKLLLLMEIKQQIKMDLKYERWCQIAIRYYGIFLAVISVILCCYMTYIRSEDDSIVIYRWMAVIVCSIALMALVWSLYHQLELYLIKRRNSESSVLTVNSASVNEPNE